MSSPRLMRSASSLLRATKTEMVASTSGCTAIVTFCWPITLIGESSQTCGRETAMPSAASASTMSRTETEPNSWPDSAAWRMITISLPSIFSATLPASPLALMLLASSSARMPSYLARFSVVARSALPRLRRKLRAKPSRTLTTSPIWPSLATRSSRMTSISVLLQMFAIEGLVKMLCRGQRRRPRAGKALAESEQGIGEAEHDHGQHRPEEHHHDRVGAAEPDRAAAQGQRQRMQHRKAGKRIAHQKRTGGNLRHHGQQAAGEAERHG